MATVPEIKAALKTALANRQENADADEFDTLFRLVRGKLRTAFSNPPLGQVAPKMVDLFLVGRRDSPPGANRPQLRSLVKMAFGAFKKEFKVPPPSKTVTEALVNVSIGWENDHSLPTLPGVGQTILVQNIVGLYLAGG